MKRLHFIQRAVCDQKVLSRAKHDPPGLLENVALVIAVRSVLLSFVGGRGRRADWEARGGLQTPGISDLPKTFCSNHSNIAPLIEHLAQREHVEEFGGEGGAVKSTIFFSRFYKLLYKDTKKHFCTH